MYLFLKLILGNSNKMKMNLFNSLMPFNKLNSASFKCRKVLGKKKQPHVNKVLFFDSYVFT